MAKKGKPRWFTTGQELPLVGDWAGTPGRKGRRLSRGEMIRHQYPVQLGGLEEEGIMGIPTWMILLGAVVIGGGLYYYYKSRQVPAA